MSTEDKGGGGRILVVKNSVLICSLYVNVFYNHSHILFKVDNNKLI